MAYNPANYIPRYDFIKQAGGQIAGTVMKMPELIEYDRRVKHDSKIKQETYDSFEPVIESLELDDLKSMGFISKAHGFNSIDPSNKKVSATDYAAHVSKTIGLPLSNLIREKKKTGQWEEFYHNMAELFGEDENASNMFLMAANAADQPDVASSYGKIGGQMAQAGQKQKAAEAETKLSTDQAAMVDEKKMTPAVAQQAITAQSGKPPTKATSDLLDRMEKERANKLKQAQQLLRTNNDFLQTVKFLTQEQKVKKQDVSISNMQLDRIGGKITKLQQEVENLKAEIEAGPTQIGTDTEKWTELKQKKLEQKSKELDSLEKEKIPHEAKLMQAKENEDLLIDQLDKYRTGGIGKRKALEGVPGTPTAIPQARKKTEGKGF